MRNFLLDRSAPLAVNSLQIEDRSRIGQVLINWWEELRNMKHILCVSAKVPAKADGTQDILCEITHEIALVIEAMGGSLPFVSYLDAKCQIIPPVTTA
jgi:hypothetical protein